MSKQVPERAGSDSVLPNARQRAGQCDGATSDSRARAAETKRIRTRTSILEAVEYLGDHGESITVKAVCDTAKISSATFYNHFSNVDDVVQLGADRVAHRFQSDVFRQIFGETKLSDEKVLRVAAYLVNAIYYNSWVWNHVGSGDVVDRFVLPIQSVLHVMATDEPVAVTAEDVNGDNTFASMRRQVSQDQTGAAVRLFVAGVMRMATLGQLGSLEERRAVALEAVEFIKRRARRLRIERLVDLTPRTLSTDEIREKSGDSQLYKILDDIASVQFAPDEGIVFG